MANWSHQSYTIKGYGAPIADIIRPFVDADLRDFEVKTADAGQERAATLTFDSRWLPAADLLQAVAERYPTVEIAGYTTDDMLNYSYELVYSEGVWTARDRLPECVSPPELAPSSSTPPFSYADRERGPLFQLLASDVPDPNDTPLSPWGQLGPDIDEDPPF